MTQAAQMALRRVIEKFTTNTRFCLICNYVNRIIPALQSRCTRFCSAPPPPSPSPPPPPSSRCTRFRFQPLPEQVVRERLQQIAHLEGVTVLDAGVDGILHLSKGDMRKCLNIMQSASMFSPSIDESAVYATVGAPPPSVVAATMHVLLNQPLNESVDHVLALMTSSGVAVQDLITELHGFVVRMKLPPKVLLYLLVRMCAVCFNSPPLTFAVAASAERDGDARQRGRQRPRAGALGFALRRCVFVAHVLLRRPLLRACSKWRGT
jgi:replication factor C subunit 3/5